MPAHAATAFVGVSFLSPAGFLVALAVVLPLLGFALLERRAARVRVSLGLAAPDPRSRWTPVGLLAAVAVLLGLAAAQPVLSLTHSRAARSDAEVIFAFDVSKSMEASSSPGSPSRLDRAKSLAVRVRGELGDVPAGIVALTDRTLPDLFPTANGGLFRAAVRDDIRPEYPPPDSGSAGGVGGRATSLGSLMSVATQNYYSPGVTRRLLIVLSDDESNPFSASTVAAVFRKAPRIRPIFVHIWRADERVWGQGGRVNPHYLPDPSSGETVSRLAAATNARVFGEGDVAAIAAAARAELGTGSSRRRRIDRARTPIAAWVALAAIVPLGFVLRRRNLPATARG
jgi:hypothetical protein